jgi:hypothetical protein
MQLKFYKTMGTAMPDVWQILRRTDERRLEAADEGYTVRSILFSMEQGKQDEMR